MKYYIWSHGISLNKATFCAFSPSCLELFYTERAHVRTLKVLDQVFYQRVSREGILSPSELRKIFSNLEDILQLHGKRN